MTILRSFFAASLLAAGLAGSAALRAEPGHKFKPLTPEEIRAIGGAVPDHSRATPAHPRSILVFYRTEGYTHASIPYANEALRQLGEKTGAYRADFSEDMAVFTPERLARYDAVVLQNTTGLAFRDPAERAALLDYIRSGKGFVGIHAASDNFNTWPEAQAMLGGHFGGHLWLAQDSSAIKVDDPSSPVVAAFGGKGFWLREEIYQIVGPFSRARQRVLLSLDMSRPENIRPAEKFTRTDADFPIAWLKPYGQGRVFYTSLGHNPDLYYNPVILQHYLDGIQYAIGDLPADSAPPTRPIAPALAPTGPALTLQEVQYAKALQPDYIEQLAGYNNYGWDRTPLLALDAYLRAHGPAVHPEIEAALLGLLARPALSSATRDYILRTLAAIGSPASVPALEKALNDSLFGSTAVDALFEIPGPESDAALLRGMGSVSGAVRLSLINAVARRRLAASVPELKLLTGSADRDTASAALTGLGDIGTPEALRAIHASRPAPELAVVRLWAELGAASHLLAQDAEERDASRLEIETVDREILAAPGPDSARCAALAGLLRADGRTALPIVVGKLTDKSPRVRLTAANLLAQNGSGSVLLQLPPLDSATQAVLLDALDTAHTHGALPLFLNGLQGPRQVRLAAIRGLGGVTEPAAIAPLLARLEGNPDDAAAAADSLSRLRAPGVSQTLAAGIAGAGPVRRAALLRILAARVDRRVYPLAMAAVGDASPDVRTAAFGALAATSRAADLPTILTLLPQAKTSAERRSMEHALLEIVRAAPRPDAVVDAIDQSLATARGPSRNSLLTALALAGTDHAAATLSAILHSDSPSDRHEALLAISSSKNSRLEGLLLATARAPADSREGILALRDYLDLMLVPDGRSPEELIRGYADAWPLATRPEEQDAITAALRNLKTDDAIQLSAKLEASRPKP